MSAGKHSPPPSSLRAAQAPLRAPQADGAALFVPPLASAAQLVEQNRARAAQRHGDYHGRSFAELSRDARQELLAAALEYTGRYAATDWLPADSIDRPFILSGHQPELFHPGVWLKNFALSAIGQSLDAVAINLIVDNDAAHAAAIRVPTGAPSEPRVEAIPLDSPQAEVPWEERRIADRELFDSAAERVLAAFEPLRTTSQLPQYAPIIRSLWPSAIAAAEAHGEQARLGNVLAQARHQFEQSIGLRTLEVPLSKVCQTTSFRWFVSSLLADLPKLREVYNECLDEYRRTNQIRSRSHPVPELEQRDDWHEAPLWIWSTKKPHRQRLFARRIGQRIELTDFASLQAELPLGGGSLPSAIEQLAVLEKQGIKLRPRALLTTMYARMFLSNLFLHGIGGAKYDELTDAIIRNYFHFEPPEFLTATATVRLPIERPALGTDSIRTLDRNLRDLRYHPELFAKERSIADSQQFEILALEKQAMLREYSLRGATPEVYERFDELNRRMFSALQTKQEQLVAERAEASNRSREAALLGSREFSLSLFPAETLPKLLLDLCAVRS